jgi:hypothetical protein
LVVAIVNASLVLPGGVRIGGVTDTTGYQLTFSASKVSKNEKTGTNRHPRAGF